MLTLPISWTDIDNLSSTLPWEEELIDLVHALIENNVSGTLNQKDRDRMVHVEARDIWQW